MNLQSVRWAFNAGRQHCTHPGQLALLLVIAGSVDRSHRGCVLNLEQLASASVMTIDEVQVHLAALERTGLIKLGNQRDGENFKPGRRPVVWDLAHADRSGPDVRGRTVMNLPVAVYRLYDSEGQLLYIGMTLDRDLRWSNHAATKPWWPQVARSTMSWYESWGEADSHERHAILTERPIHNDAFYPERPHRVGA